MSAAGRLRPLVGILAAVVLLELILRQLYWGIQTWKPHLGWGYYDTELRRYYFEGGSTSHWDAQGIRITPGPVLNGPAILAVGDSVTQATQVADGEVYTALLQRRLGLPVLNVGHDAQSLAGDVSAASAHLADLDVAWTIVQFIPLDFEEQPNRAEREHFKLVDGHLVAEPAIVRFGRLAPLTHPLRRHSALVNLGILRLVVLRDTPMPPLFRAADPKTEVRHRYGPVELELDSLRDAYRGKVTMFLVPEFLTPETSAEQRFANWCAQNNISCVNLRSVFDDFRRRGRAPTGFPNSLFGNGHLNPEGHVAAANLLAAEIERLRARGLF